MSLLSGGCAVRSKRGSCLPLRSSTSHGFQESAPDQAAWRSVPLARRLRARGLEMHAALEAPARPTSTSAADPSTAAPLWAKRLVCRSGGHRREQPRARHNRCPVPRPRGPCTRNANAAGAMGLRRPRTISADTGSALQQVVGQRGLMIRTVSSSHSVLRGQVRHRASLHPETAPARDGPGAVAGGGGCRPHRTGNCETLR